MKVISIILKRNSSDVKCMAKIIRFKKYLITVPDLFLLRRLAISGSGSGPVDPGLVRTSLHPESLAVELDVDA